MESTETEERFESGCGLDLGHGDDLSVGIRSGLRGGAVGTYANKTGLGHDAEAEEAFGKARRRRAGEPAARGDGVLKGAGTVQVIDTGLLHCGGKTTTGSLEIKGEGLRGILIDGTTGLVEDADIVKRHGDVVARGEAIEFEGGGWVRCHFDLIVIGSDIDTLIVITGENDLSCGIIALRGAREIIERLGKISLDPGETGGMEFTHGAETGRHALFGELGKGLDRLGRIGLDFSRAKRLAVEEDGTERGEGIRVTRVSRLVEPLPGLVVIDFLGTAKFEEILGQFKHGLAIVFRRCFFEQLEGEVRVFRLTGKAAEIDRRHVAAGRVEPAFGRLLDVADTFLSLLELLR